MLCRLYFNSSQKNLLKIHKNVQPNLGVNHISIVSLNMDNFTDTNKYDRITYTQDNCVMNNNKLI